MTPQCTPPYTTTHISNLNTPNTYIAVRHSPCFLTSILQYGLEETNETLTGKKSEGMPAMVNSILPCAVEESITASLQLSRCFLASYAYSPSTSPTTGDPTPDLGGEGRGGVGRGGEGEGRGRGGEGRGGGGERRKERRGRGEEGEGRGRGGEGRGGRRGEGRGGRRGGGGERRGREESEMYRLKNYYWPLAIFHAKFPNGQPYWRMANHIGEYNVNSAEICSMT